MRQLLRPGGRLAFTTIFVAPGLDRGSRARARRSGPRAVGTRSDYLHMLASAGFHTVDQLDVTARFRDTQAAWMAQVTDHYDELVANEGADAVRERQRDQRLQLRAIDDGLLRRAIFTGASPQR